MILGYLDANERAYDLGFATLRLRIRFSRDAGVQRIEFSSSKGGEVGYPIVDEGDVTASAAMDHGGDLVPLLRAVEGRLYRHERGVYFLAAPTKRDPEDPTFFLVKLRAMPSAVQFFFEDQGGTEFISIPDDEILSVATSEDHVRLSVTAANLALPKEKLAYAVDFAPTNEASRLVRGLGLSQPV